MRNLRAFLEFLKGSSQVDLGKLKNHRVVLNFWIHLKPYRMTYLLMCLAMAAAITASLLQPIVYKHLVDDVLTNELGTSSIKLLVIDIAALVILRMISIVSGVYKQIWDGKLVYSATADLEKKVYRKIQRLPMGYFDHHTGGDLLPR